MSAEDTVEVSILISDLERETWTFSILTYPHAYLDRYAREVRESKRHKWKAKCSWHRLGLDRSLEVGERMAAEPHVPADVRETALTVLRSKLRIESWTERQKRVSRPFHRR